jgi:phosphatidylserine decarboxylase
MTSRLTRANPFWGFTSWNDFFHRQIKPEKRPVSSPNDPNVIVSANDGHVYNFAANVQKYDTFWAKGQRYSLGDMLNRQHLDRFIKDGVGADVIQSFLSGNDYHRFVAPITGTVIEPQTVPGLMFSNAESAGFDPGAGVLSQGYEVAVNTRGLVFIESPEKSIGMVCVIPIGITEVSSITLKVKDKQEVKKGDELGYFSFGGSTLCMVFQPGVIDYYTLRAPWTGDLNAGPQGSINSAIKAKEQIALTKK